MARLSERLDASERVLFHKRAHPAIWIRLGAGTVELIQNGFAKYLGFAFVRLMPAEGDARTVGFVSDPAALRQALGNAGAG